MFPEIGLELHQSFETRFHVEQTRGVLILQCSLFHFTMLWFFSWWIPWILFHWTNYIEFYLGCLFFFNANQWTAVSWYNFIAYPVLTLLVRRFLGQCKNLKKEFVNAGPSFTPDNFLIFLWSKTHQVKIKTDLEKGNSDFIIQW